MAYYNKEVECMERAEIRAHQLDALKKQVKRVYENVPMYRKRMDDAGVKPEDINSIDDIVTSIDDISKNSQSQSEAIEQVTQGVEQLSTVTQNNSAASEQSAAAAEELAGQANTMKSLVGRFTLHR